MSNKTKDGSHPVWQVSNPQLYTTEPTVTIRPLTDWEQWSTTAFLHDWTLPESVTGFGVGFLEFLPELASTAAPDLDLSHALRAASFALFANQHNSQHMFARARDAYGRALTALNTSLRNPVHAVRDTTITTIILLQIFEHIMSDDSLSLGNHDAGLRMLLDMRGEQQLDNARGRGIARIVFGYLFSRNINLKRETCEVMKHGAHRLGFPPEHPSQQRRPGSPGIPEILRNLGPLLERAPTDIPAKAEAFRLMQAAAEFDQRYDKWVEILPPGWAPHQIYINPDQILAEPTTVPGSGFVHIYHSPIHACHSSAFRMQYIVLHKRLIATALHFGISAWSLPPSEAYPKGYHESVANSTAIIQQRIHQVLSSVACAVGEITSTGQRITTSAGRSVGAYYLLWPLMAIARDEYATPEQQADATRALSYIGHTLGVKRALQDPKRPLAQGNSPRSEWDNPTYRKSSPSTTSTSSSALDFAISSEHVSPELIHRRLSRPTI